MSIQASDIAGSLQRALQVQQVHAAHQDAETAAAKQRAADLERLARQAEEEVNTSAPTAGKNVHERDAGQGSDYVPRRRPPAPPPENQKPDEVASHPPNLPGQGTLIDIQA